MSVGEAAVGDDDNDGDEDDASNDDNNECFIGPAQLLFLVVYAFFSNSLFLPSPASSLLSLP